MNVTSQAQRIHRLQSYEIQFLALLFSGALGTCWDPHKAKAALTVTFCGSLLTCKSRPMPSVSKGRKGQNSGNVVNIKKANTRMSTPLVVLSHPDVNIKSELGLGGLHLFDGDLALKPRSIGVQSLLAGHGFTMIHRLEKG